MHDNFAIGISQAIPEPNLDVRFPQTRSVQCKDLCTVSSLVAWLALSVGSISIKPVNMFIQALSLETCVQIMVKHMRIQMRCGMLGKQKHEHSKVPRTNLEAIHRIHWISQGITMGSNRVQMHGTLPACRSPIRYSLGFLFFGYVVPTFPVQVVG